jgi:hypothetical protein
MVFPLQRVEWISGLPPATCLERLRDLGPIGCRHHSVGPANVAFARVAYTGRGPGQPHLHVFCRPSVAGTLISGRFVPSPFALAFGSITVWAIMLGLLFAANVSVANGVRFLNGFAHTALGFGLLVAGSVAMAVGVVTWSGWPSQCERISQEVMRVCEASPVVNSASPGLD